MQSLYRQSSKTIKKEIMRALKSIRTVRKREPQLRVVRGGLYPTSKKEKRIEQFWLFCQAALWNNQQFSESEVTEFKKLIAEYFKKSKDTDKIFTQLIERVCLAKRYVSRKPGRYMSKPIDWLNINYKNGLRGTYSWFKQVQQQRRSVPHYNEGISKLAEAVLSYCDKPNSNIVYSSRRELLKLNQYDLNQMFMNTIIHMQYLNN
jgi:hypothetical protein